jgi:hypothetical protein
MRAHRSRSLKARFIVISLGLLAALLVAGCGGGGGSTVSAGPSGEASKEFQDPAGGGKSIITFGVESGETERRAASKVLAENLSARQEADFETQCGTLGKRGLKAVAAGVGQTKVISPTKCKSELQKLASPLPGTKKIREDTLSGEIAALRVEGKQAWALFHGSDGKDWAMPMEEEGGNWKVGGIIVLELPKVKPAEKAKEPQSKGASGSTH